MKTRASWLLLAALVVHCVAAASTVPAAFAPDGAQAAGLADEAWDTPLGQRLSHTLRSAAAAPGCFHFPHYANADWYTDDASTVLVNNVIHLFGYAFQHGTYVFVLDLGTEPCQWQLKSSDIDYIGGSATYIGGSSVVLIGGGYTGLNRCHPKQHDCIVSKVYTYDTEHYLFTLNAEATQVAVVYHAAVGYDNQVLAIGGITPEYDTHTCTRIVVLLSPQQPYLAPLLLLLCPHQQGVAFWCCSRV